MKGTLLSAAVRKPDECVFNITGNLHFITDIVEQLAWVTSALQDVPRAAWVVEYQPKLEFLPQRCGPDKKIQSECRLEVDRVRVEYWNPDVDPGFKRNFTLVSGFPILVGDRLSNNTETLQEACLVEPCALPRGYDLRILRLPTPLRETVATVSKSLITFARGSEDRRQLVNDTKLLLEHYTGYLWDWWPLKNPVYKTEYGEQRVSWTVSTSIFRDFRVLILIYVWPSSPMSN